MDCTPRYEVIDPAEAQVSHALQRCDQGLSRAMHEDFTSICAAMAEAPEICCRTGVEGRTDDVAERENRTRPALKVSLPVNVPNNLFGLHRFGSVELFDALF
ncbi:hypothetical protein FF011L_11980 [Roseimaritima multifibrata]|uniref:Uncharacterized protein n=1 Tax=Roseimaritima multifibrata TaxID=1930274 RepID=A0A517MC60_9BACT|nr:hypothetical protein FF011L_11980 [Roseimaritima multifibrata]